MSKEPGLRPPDIERTLHRAITTLVAVQKPDGQWGDFEIPEVGTSGAWVTAHVGLKLCGLPRHLRTAEVDRALDRAAGFLRPDTTATWGYSPFSPPDADSTAHAVLFLHAMGRPPAGTTLRFLLKHQQPDGGFATFLASPGMARSHSWCRSHPDVTAMVIRALAPFTASTGVAEHIARARAYMIRVRQDEGRWPVFWWHLDWYTAANWLETLRAIGDAPGSADVTVAEPSMTPRASLDAGLLLTVLSCLGDHTRASPLALQLAARQLDTGLWPTTPVLRVTRPDVERPWTVADAGPLYADNRGIYSGATIAASIARAVFHEPG